LDDDVKLARTATSLSDSPELVVTLSSRDNQGDIVEIETEKEWKTVGWPLAVKVFEEGEKRGSLEAMKFTVEVQPCVLLPYFLSSRC
jgi:hypothetical protein